jgi:hypothetical protein
LNERRFRCGTAVREHELPDLGAVVVAIGEPALGNVDVAAAIYSKSIARFACEFEFDESDARARRWFVRVAGARTRRVRFAVVEHGEFFAVVDPESSRRRNREPVKFFEEFVGGAALDLERRPSRTELVDRCVFFARSPFYVNVSRGGVRGQAGVVNRDPSRFFELKPAIACQPPSAFACAPLVFRFSVPDSPPPCFEEVAGGVEAVDTVVAAVDDVDIAGCVVYRDPGGFAQLAGCRAFGTERPGGRMSALAESLGRAGGHLEGDDAGGENDEKPRHATATITVGAVVC